MRREIAKDAVTRKGKEEKKKESATEAFLGRKKKFFFKAKNITITTTQKSKYISTMTVV